MTKNKKSFLVGVSCNIFIFIIGCLVMFIPSYYGEENVLFLDTCDLFISIMLIISSIKFSEHILIGSKKNYENITISLSSAFLGVSMIFFNRYFESSMCVILCMLIYTFFLFVINLSCIESYRKEKNSFCYIKTIFTIIMCVIGLVLTFNMNYGIINQILMLGCYLMFFGILSSIETAFICMLKSKKFLNNLKK